MALEYGTPNMPEMVDGKTRLGGTYFNPLHKRIDQRVSALEELKVSWQDATDLLTKQGLARIDAVLVPAFEEIDESLATLAGMLATAQAELDAAAEGALDQIQPQIDAKLDAMDVAIAALNAAVTAGNAAIAAAVSSAGTATTNANNAATAANAAAAGVGAAIADFKNGTATIVSTATPAVIGGRYKVSTSGGAVTITLPASPAEGEHVTVWRDGTNSATIAHNGKTIEGLSENLVLDVDKRGVRLTYLFGSWRVFPAEVLP